MTKRRIIFILGMHRSGTSVLTRCLNLQGVTLPKTLMPPQKDNEKGFWESLPIVRFNNMLLKEAGVAWDEPKPIDASWWQSSKLPDWVDQASLLLQQEFSQGELVVLKDPRISRLMPIWIEACRKTGFSPLVLLCCRNPLDVISSLKQRNKFSFQYAEHLWLRYMLEAERGSRGLMRSVVHFDNLIGNWKETIKQAYTNIGLEIPLLEGGVTDQINEFISPNFLHHNAKKGNLLYDNRKLESLTKDTYEVFFHKLLGECIFDGLVSRLNRADFIKPPAEHKPLSESNVKIREIMTTEIEQKIPDEEVRKVILHYHLFKNAGTSLDAAFKENFKGDEWVTKEFPAQPAKNREQVAQWILDNPQAKCFSSHTAMLPPPKLESIKVLPVIFMRHPIDRIASAYAFEKKQGGDSFGAVLARNTDFKGYVETRLALPNDRQCRNFHTHRFAAMFGEKQGGEFTRAKMAVERLPFVGVVDKFENFLVELEAWLEKEGFDGVNIKPIERNVSRSTKVPLEIKLDGIRDELGDEVYVKLINANKEDFEIYSLLVGHVN